MQNKKVVILIVLGALAVLSLIRGILTPSKIRREIASRSVVVRKTQPLTAAEAVAPSVRGTRRTDFASWGRSPFMPRKTKARTFTELTLDGILWDKRKPLAVINDEMVGIGDTVGGNTVVDIKEDRVILNDGTTNFQLRLGQ